MATKAKDGSVVGKEKKAPSSNTPIKSTKRTIKPSISEKPVPNYLKPTISSLPESLRQSFSNRPNLDRRRSFDKPPSPSRLPKLQKEPSPSRQGLVSPSHVPRVRSLNRSNTLPDKCRNILPSKPNSDRRISRKSSPTPSHEANSKKHIEEVINVVETEGRNDHEENSNNASEVEVERVEENVSQLIPPQVVEENQNVVDIEDGDNEKVIPPTPIVSEDQEKIKDDEHEKEEEQEKIKDDEHEKEEEKEKIKDDEHEKEEECINEEINGSTTEGEVDDIKQEEEKEESGVINDDNITVEEDHKKNEEEEEKEGGTSEVVEGEEEHVESSSEVEEAKVEEESTKPSKKESHSQVSNDVIEETASKLLEERKNKVRALAGAFQTVIDYQTK